MIYLSNGPNFVFHYSKVSFLQFLIVPEQFLKKGEVSLSNKAGDNTPRDLSWSQSRNYLTKDAIVSPEV